MATLSQLVETVAEVEGMDPATVSLIARSVREAGLITTAGRGLSAAKMTFADAVNLLIAVNATVTARDAPQTIRNYRRLETVVGRTLLPRPVRSLLGDALEQLIEAVSHRSLPQLFLSSTVPNLISQAFRNGQAQIELTFHKPMPFAYLTISTLDEGLSVVGGLVPEYESFDWVFNSATKIEFNFNQVTRRASEHYGDRKDTTSIGYSTFRAIGDLLRE